MSGGDPLIDVTPGAPLHFSASRHNLVNEATRRVLSDKGRAGAAALETLPDYAEVRIKNNSGQTVPRFGVLGINGFLITPPTSAQQFTAGPTLSGVTPTEATHTGKFVILRDRLANGRMGRGLVAGAVICKVDMQNATDKFADVFGGNVTKLKSADSGLARIIQVESGTGEKWALIAFGGGGGGGETVVGPDCQACQISYRLSFVAAGVTNATVTGGSATLQVGWTDGSGNNQVTELNIPWNALAVAVDTLIDEADIKQPGDVITVSGGQLPPGEVVITISSTRRWFVRWLSNSLTGTGTISARATMAFG